MGNCSRCGKCCKFVDFTVPVNASVLADALNMDIGDMSRYYSFRNIKVILDEKKTTFRIMNQCSQLGEDNLCKIWDSNPGICKGQQENKYIVKPEGCTD